MTERENKLYQQQELLSIALGKIGEFEDYINKEFPDKASEIQDLIDKAGNALNDIDNITTNWE